MEKKETNFAKISLLSVLGLVVLFGGAYFIYRTMQHSKAKEYLESALALAGQNNLNPAYEAILLAGEINPNDSAIIKQRRTILRLALEQHTADLEEVRGMLEAKDESMYSDICGRLEAHKNNASILKNDDSTAHFQALIPGCLGVPPNTPIDDNNNGDNGNTPSTNTLDKQNTLPEQNTGTNSSTVTPKPDDSKTITPPVDKKLDPAEEAEKNRIKQDLMDWNTAKKTDTENSYLAYINQWQNQGGSHISDARQRYDEIIKAKTPPPPPPKPLAEAELAKTGRTGLPLSERDINCATTCKGGTLILTPTTSIELSEMVLFGYTSGKVQIELQDDNGRKLGSMRGTVTVGRSQFSLDDLSVRLKAGQRYKLIVTPQRNPSGAIPDLEDMRNCNPTGKVDPNLKTDYQSNYFIFDLKYNY
jgi:hypothetical protein